MTTVSVVVPYRGDNGGPRDQAWDYVQRWWAEECPDWQLVVGYLDPAEPWVKARAVADGLRDATRDMLVIADADVVADRGTVRAAADSVAVQIARGDRSGWAMPHTRVRRLTRDATEAVLGGGPLPDPLEAIAPPVGRWRGGGPVAEAHRGMAGGGMVVLPRASYERVPMDPRFVEWGQEDAAFGLALSTLLGPPRRGGTGLWHLWHPPQPRLTRAIGSHDSLALYKRYQAAKGSPELMNRILAEVSG